MSFETMKNNPNIWETLKDFAEKQNISLDQKDLLTYGKQILSEKQKQLISQWETNISKIMESINQRNALSDELNTQRIEASRAKSVEINNAGNREKQKSAEEAESLFDQLNDDTDISKKVDSMKKASWEVKQQVEKKVQDMWVDTFFDTMADKTGGIIWEIFKFFKWIFSWFSWVMWLSKISDTVKQELENVLTPEERKQHLEYIEKNIPQVSQKIQESLGIQHPVLDKKINEIIQNPDLVSEKSLQTLVEKMKAGEPISLSLLKESLWEDYSKAFDTLRNETEVKDALTLKVQKLLTDKVAEEYGFSLNFDKKEKLWNIIQQFESDFAFAELLEQFANWETIYVSNILNSVFKDWEKAMEFNWALISSGIIWISNLWFHLVEGTQDLVQFWFAWLWFETEVTLDNFLEQLSGMSESQKAMFIAVMYRKWGFVSELLWKITGFIAKAWLEALSPASLSMVDEFKNFSGNTQSQIKSYQKLHNVLWNWDDKFIEYTSKALKQISTQTEVANALNKAQEYNYNPRELKELIQSIGWKEMADKTYLQKVSDIINSSASEVNYSDLRQKIASGTEFSEFKFKDFQSIKAAIFPGKHQFVDELSHGLKTLANFQEQRILNGKGIKSFSKANAAIKAGFEQFSIWQKFDKLVFETGNLSEVNKTFKEMKKFATQFPEQAKLSLWAIGEVALLWIWLATLQEDESTWNEICESLMYMTGILGSWAMMFSLGGAFNKETWEIEVVNAWIWALWTWLFVYDMVRATKIVYVDPSFRWVWKALWDVVLRPITNLWKWWIATAKFAANAARATPEAVSALSNVSKEIAKNWINWQKIGASMLSKMKWKKGRVWLFLWLTAAVWTGTAMALETDISAEYQDMIDKKIIDSDGNILNPQKAQEFFHTEFSEDEKNMFVELILNNNNLIQIGTHVHIDSIENGIIKLKAYDKSIENWCIEREQKDILEKFGYTTQFV